MFITPNQLIQRVLWCRDVDLCMLITTRYVSVHYKLRYVQGRANTFYSDKLRFCPSLANNNYVEWRWKDPYDNNCVIPEIRMLSTYGGSLV